MVSSEDSGRELVGLVVARQGSLLATGEPFEPFRLLDPAGRVVSPVAVFFGELQACGRPATTQRSYGMALLRWFRFLWAVGVPWNEATRVEARDFSRWLQVAAKPVSLAPRGGTRVRAVKPAAVRVASGPNAVTGKARPGVRYAPATAAHGETVCRGFYDFHLQAGSGPMVNPFPPARDRRGGRLNAHHNPMEVFSNARSGLYRPRLARRAPRQMPDDCFDGLFAALGSHRDRALVALWVSTGARASELLGVNGGDVDPGSQLITVIRKGSRAFQQLPASPDAFVWLRLYQQQLHGLVAAGRDQPLWWTLRRPFRRLSYHGAYRMFTRAAASLGANWSLHDLRHTAAYRMARDPLMPLTDVQWVLGHAHLTTTQLYLSPLPEDVIANMVAFHARRGEQPPDVTPRAGHYRPESLDVLFGTDR